MPSPHPLPTQLKILRGTAKPHRLVKDEPKPDNDKIEMPFNLSRGAKKQWVKVEAELRAAKIITNVDTHALALFCEYYAEWIDAMTKIRKEGAVVFKDGIPAGQSPYFHVANKAFDRLQKMLTEFGMTPSSRTRVSATGPSDDDDF